VSGFFENTDHSLTINHKIIIMRIRTFRLSHLRNEEHFGFHTGILETLGKLGASIVAQPYLNGYARHCETLNEVVEVIRRSVITGQLAAADKYRTSLFRGLRDKVKGELHHYNKEKRHAARQIYHVLRSHSEITEKSRNAKIGAFVTLFTQLHEQCVPEIALLGLTEWVQVLEASNENYLKLEAARCSEKAAQPKQKVTEVRRMVDAYYKALTDHINALTVLAPGTEGLTELINELNVRVAAYHCPMAQRQGIREAHKRETESTYSEANIANLIKS
jgi:hypothetical protein